LKEVPVGAHGDLALVASISDLDQSLQLHELHLQSPLDHHLMGHVVQLLALA
jgi:hypothetical protein